MGNVLYSIITTYNDNNNCCLVYIMYDITPQLMGSLLGIDESLTAFILYSNNITNHNLDILIVILENCSRILTEQDTVFIADLCGSS